MSNRITLFSWTRFPRWVAWVVEVPIREGRRIIGRPKLGSTSRLYCLGNRISRRDYNDDYYRQTLLPEIYRLKTVLAGLEATAVIAGTKSLEETTRTTLYDLPVIGHYAIDFHPA